MDDQSISIHPFHPIKSQNPKFKDPFKPKDSLIRVYQDSLAARPFRQATTSNKGQNGLRHHLPWSVQQNSEPNRDSTGTQPGQFSVDSAHHIFSQIRKSLFLNWNWHRGWHLMAGTSWPLPAPHGTHGCHELQPEGGIGIVGSRNSTRSMRARSTSKGPGLQPPKTWKNRCRRCLSERSFRKKDRKKDMKEA